MAFPSRKTILASMFLAALLLLVGLPFLNLNRFRGRLESAISGSLNRSVALGDVTFQLLPTPAFNITNFIVEDDPAFSAEPMLRAEKVIASLRWISLWRGRLEISRLSVKYPSLNLVRLRDGRWNLETLLTRAAQVSASAAPTANSRVEERPRFPYIEAQSGRINLKSGQEKMVWAVSDADFALWLESENKWRMRLEGQPLRTDENLNDAGRMRAEGEFVRAARLRETPLTLRISVQHAQLGQLSKLVYGRDRGWRGGVDLATTLQGSPQNLNITTQLVVTDFRRYDIATTDQIRMEARCTGEFHSQSLAPESLLQNYAAASECIVPATGGEVRLRAGWANGQAAKSKTAALSTPAGHFQASLYPDAAAAKNLPGQAPVHAIQIDAPAGAAQYLQVSVKNLPMASLLIVARRIKKDLPPDLTATGALNAALGFISPASEVSASLPPGLPVHQQAGWNGMGAISGLTLRSSVLGSGLVVGNVPFIVNAVIPVAPQRGRRKPAPSRKAQVAAPAPPLLNNLVPQAEKSGSRVVAGPFLLGLDGTSPAALAAQFTRSGYQVNAQGSASPARLLALGQALGLPRLPAGYRLLAPAASAAAPAAAPSSAAQTRFLAEIDLQVAGEWAKFAPPRLQGSVQLHNVTAEIAAMAKPVEIKSGKLSVTESEISAQNIVAAIPGSHIDLQGSISLPRGCSSPQLCVMTFDIRAGQVDLDEVNRLLNPRLRPGLWSILRSSLPGSGAPDSGASGSAGVANFWKGRRAQGHLAINRLVMKLVAATQVTADLNLAGDKLFLSNTRASLWGGVYQGQWSADFSLDPPVFEGNGTLQNISLAETAGVMRENWASGPASITGRLSFSGHNFDDYKRSIIATISFDWKNGLLRHVVLDGGAPLSFTEWSGKAEVRNQDVLFTPGRMQTRSGAYTAQGTASFARNINFSLNDTTTGYAISGTLSQPAVSTGPQPTKSPASHAAAR